jgi:hypothetical protein
MTTDSRGYQKNTNENGDKMNLGSLIRKGGDDEQVLSMLREKYPSDKDLVNKMFSEYEDQMSKIRRKAQKFAQLVLTKYNHLGQKRIMEKAKKLKTKYNFSDDEFEAFKHIAFTDKAFTSLSGLNTPNTPMSRTLGYMPDANMASMGKMTIKGTELDVVQDILKTHQANSGLHQNVIIQSLTYRDCAPEAVNGVYKKDKHNPYTYVHPVVAALFLPRIKYIDEHMLMASLSNIVASRYNNQPIKDKPTYELYWDLITDPNEAACVGRDARDSPLVDLRNRINVQVELWKAVRALRQGRYYEADTAGFMLALDSCKNSGFDAVDTLMLKDEGAILRRLLGAFSFRPTIVGLSLLGGSQSFNYSMSSLSMTQVTSIPMINLRLPVNVKNPNVHIDLKEAFEQQDWYVENKMLVTKVKNVIHSRDVLFFYVNRRFQNVNFGRLAAPYNFSALPITASGFESLNDVPVNFDMSFKLPGASDDDRFQLRSCVFVEKASFINKCDVKDINNDLIIGCTTAIVVPADPSTGHIDTTVLLYDPLGASASLEDQNGEYVSNPPITWIPDSAPLYGNGGNDSFRTRAATRGVIFTYVKDNQCARPCF